MSGKNSSTSLAQALWPCKLLYLPIPYHALTGEG
jgi:hypothetical protein